MAQSRIRLTMCAGMAGAALLGLPAAIAAGAPSASAAGHGAATDAATAPPSAAPPTTSTDPTATTGASTPAGTVTVSAGCFVNTAKSAAKVTVDGAGWSPGDTIQLTDSRGVVTSTVTASTSGIFAATVSAPVVPTRDVDISDRIEAVDQGSEGATTTGGPTAYSADFLTTDYAVKVSGSDPSKKLAFSLSGFTPGKVVYGHYLTAGGKLLATASFGTPTGACGLRKVDAYEYPDGKARRGDYVIQFDNDAHYSAHTTPDFRYSFAISRL